MKKQANNIKNLMNYIITNKFEKTAIIAGFLDEEKKYELITRKRADFWQIVLNEGKNTLLNVRSKNLDHSYYLLILALKYLALVKDQSLDIILLENKDNCLIVIYRGEKVITRMSCPYQELSKELKKIEIQDYLYNAPIKQVITPNDLTKQNGLALEYFLLDNFDLKIKKEANQNIKSTLIPTNQEEKEIAINVDLISPKKYPLLHKYLFTGDNYCIIKGIAGNVFEAKFKTVENNLLLQVESDSLKSLLEELEFNLNNNQVRIRKSEEIE